MSGLSMAERRRVQRLAAAGTLTNVFKGVYVKSEGGEAEVERRVRAHWMDIGGVLVPGGGLACKRTQGHGPGKRLDRVASDARP